MNIPSEDEMDDALRARYSQEVHGTLIRAKIGIAGLGGLGSNIAAMLTRAGISVLIIADFDVVDITNINRQNYCLDQIGMKKVDATEVQLKRINPYSTIIKHDTKLTPSNIPDIFGGCDIVCEAFDKPSEKAMLINTILEECPGVRVVSGSGMAGYGRSNEIRTERLFADLYICGDGIDMEEAEGGLMSPRVNICAGHMANTVISILMNGDP
ncbi:MAG: sulfur carrier protein ThiS adenylyltransferase ThiF [Methanomassiliicoccaceae archaeon]|nr:sulfur carrier protein ThiS adenylyltransferase ThiF [Methanomassiliicoccaceae archaeon]